MTFKQKYFLENQLTVNQKQIKYYLSPNLIKNNFKHGFFAKSSSELELSLLSDQLNVKDRNCSLNQIHSNRIVFSSMIQKEKDLEADGMICNRHNQNLWIYTADCMPILFADKKNRFIAAIHCGRKGLEKRIIKNLLKIFDKIGTLREDLLVSIGPSISKKYYLIDKKTAQDFYKKAKYKESITTLENIRILFNLETMNKFKEEDLISLDLKKYAYIQLLNENINNSNIDISSLCTYESNLDFYSWRRSKTLSRQWSFISS